MKCNRKNLENKHIPRMRKVGIVFRRISYRTIYLTMRGIHVGCIRYQHSELTRDDGLSSTSCPGTSNDSASYTDPFLDNIPQSEQKQPEFNSQTGLDESNISPTEFDAKINYINQISYYFTKKDLKKAMELVHHVVNEQRIDINLANVILKGLFDNERLMEALGFFHKFADINLNPDSTTFYILINEHLNREMVHTAFVLSQKLDWFNVENTNALVNLFIKMYCMMDKVEKAEILLQEMKESGMKPNYYTYLPMLKLYTDLPDTLIYPATSREIYLQKLEENADKALKLIEEAKAYGIDVYLYEPSRISALFAKRFEFRKAYGEYKIFYEQAKIDYFEDRLSKTWWERLYFKILNITKEYLVEPDAKEKYGMNYSYFLEKIEAHTKALKIPTDKTFPLLLYGFSKVAHRRVAHKYWLKSRAAGIKVHVYSLRAYWIFLARGANWDRLHMATIDYLEDSDPFIFRLALKFALLARLNSTGTQGPKDAVQLAKKYIDRPWGRRSFLRICEALKDCPDADFLIVVWKKYLDEAHELSNLYRIGRFDEEILHSFIKLGNSEAFVQRLFRDLKSELNEEQLISFLSKQLT